MELIKKHWKNILLGLLIIFCLSKCTQSCNRASVIDRLESENTKAAKENDSTISSLKDSIMMLNTTIKVYQERVNGMQQSLDIQNEASKRISEAKKNISVNVKQSK